jgi:hypothetical protein
MSFVPTCGLETRGGVDLLAQRRKDAEAQEKIGSRGCAPSRLPSAANGREVSGMCRLARGNRQERGRNAADCAALIAAWPSSGRKRFVGRGKGWATAAGALPRAGRFPLYSMISEEVAGNQPVSRQYIESNGCGGEGAESGGFWPQGGPPSAGKCIQTPQ